MTEVVRIFGVQIEPWTAPQLIDSVLNWCSAEGTRKTILYANIHVLNTAYDNLSLHSQLQSATTVYCDGSGVRLAATLLGHRLPSRLTGADWMYPFCARAAEERVPVYFLGGRNGVAETAAGLLTGRYPGLDVQGAHHGYLDSTSSEQVLARINDSATRVLFVGMGTPQQELWIAKYRERIAAPVVWAVGAAFDFVAGVERRGPPWMLDHHLEWAARLIADPGRLWRRYLIGNPVFVVRVLGERWLGLPSKLASE